MMLSIIIVNYNGGDMLKKCINSIKHVLDNVDFEIVVVDNNSSDHSINNLEGMFLDRIKIIKSPENLGFSKANNIGVKSAKGSVFFFLNPDTVLNDTQIQNEILKVEDGYLYYPIMIDDENSRVNNRYIFPSIKNYMNYFIQNSMTIYWVQGSAMILTKNSFEKIGGWCEDYFMYSEDLDFCYTAYRKGISLKSIPFTFAHIGGGTTRKIWSEAERLYRVEKSYYQFNKKYNLLLSYHLLKLINLCRLITKPKECLLHIMTYLKIIKSKIF
jgi:GT2 family glycosyltransferase